MPQSAWRSAGASLTPSPVMATIWPRCCSALTISYLCCGNTRPKPSARSTASAMSRRDGGVAPSLNTSLATSRWSPMPSCLAIWSPIATSSPVTILTLRPSCSVSRDRRLGVRPRRIAAARSGRRSSPGLAVVRLGDAERAIAARGEIGDGRLVSRQRGRHRAWQARQSPAARPWRNCSVWPCGIDDGRDRALVDRVERHELGLLECLRARSVSLSACSTARSIGSSLLVWVASAAPISHVVGLGSAERDDRSRP